MKTITNLTNNRDFWATFDKKNNLICIKECVPKEIEEQNIKTIDKWLNSEIDDDELYNNIGI